MADWYEDEDREEFASVPEELRDRILKCGDMIDVPSMMAVVGEFFMRKDESDGWSDLSGEDFSEIVCMSLAEKLGISMQSDLAKRATFIVVAVTLAQISEHLLGIGSGAMKLDLQGFTLSQIKSMLESIDKKVDLLKDRKFYEAREHLSKSLRLINNEEFKPAFEEIEIAMNKAIDAWAMIKRETDQEKRINKIKLMQIDQCCKILLFTTILKYSFSDAMRAFLPFKTLSDRRKRTIASEIENYIKYLIDATRKYRSRIYNRPAKKKKRKEVKRDVLDKVLKSTYPYMSEGFGWTSAKSYNPTDIEVMPKYIPEGIEDLTKLVVGRNSFGKEIGIHIMRSNVFIYCFGEESVGNVNHRSLKIDDEDFTVQLSIEGLYSTEEEEGSDSDCDKDEEERRFFEAIGSSLSSHPREDDMDQLEQNEIAMIMEQLHNLDGNSIRYPGQLRFRYIREVDEDDEGQSEDDEQSHSDGDGIQDGYDCSDFTDSEQDDDHKDPDYDDNDTNEDHGEDDESDDE